jgi:hypothetical protein
MDRVSGDLGRQTGQKPGNPSVSWSFICPAMPQKTHVSIAEEPGFHPHILPKTLILFAVT